MKRTWLSFALRAERSNGAPASGTGFRPALGIAHFLSLPAILLLGCSDHRPEAQNAVLVIVDTLRSDRLGCYGHIGARTPTLDRLARNGFQFQTAISQVPVTAPSTATILTGSYPQFHGVRDNGTFRLRESVATIAEVFASHGYRTGAFVSAAVLDRKYGLHRGYATYDDDVAIPFRFLRPDLAERNATHQNVERRGDDTTRRALAWIETAADAPFFLTVHLFDPHEPYDPPFLFLGTERNRYDAEIAYVDECIAAIVDAIESRGVLDHTVVAIVADHGQALGEHGETTHGFFVYDATLKVPFILRPGGSDVPPAIIDEPVQLLDVAPTLLALGGLRERFGQGRDLTPLWESVHTSSEPAYFENYRVRYSYGWAPLVGVRTDRWKFIRTLRPELYDLESDPGELVDLHDARPDLVESLSNELDLLLERTTERGSEALSTAMDDETRRRLDALGYVSARSTAESSVDPKDGILRFEERQLAKRIVSRGVREEEGGRPEVARASFEEAIQVAPLYAGGYFALGEFQWERGELEAAEANLSRAVELDPEVADSWTALGFVAFADGREDEARARFETAHSKSDDVATRENLLEFLVRTEKWDEALRWTVSIESDSSAGEWARKARGIVLARAGRYVEEDELLAAAFGDEDPTARFRRHELRVHRLAPRAFSELVRGRFRQALAPLGRAAEENPEDLAVSWALAWALAETGDTERAQRLLRETKHEDPLIDSQRSLVLARTWILLEKNTAAFALLRRATDVISSVHAGYTPRFWLYLAQATRGLGQLAESERYYSRALEHGLGRYWEREALEGGGRLRMRR